MTEYEIFKACFPQLVIDKETFTRLAFGKDTHLFIEEGGFAVTHGQRIALLCVAPEYQRRSIGSRLLAESEQYIRALGHNRAVIGGNMLCGAVDGSCDFFSRNGYTLGSEFKELCLELGSFSAADAMKKCTDDIEFILGDAQPEELHHAVAAVDEDWVQYFTAPNDVYCARRNGTIASFCIVGEDEDCLLSDGATKVGSIGCVGTVPEYRSKGTGLALVATAAEYLQAHGCGRVFIHMTHLDRWYGQLGAEVFLRYSMAEKELP